MINKIDNFAEAGPAAGQSREELLRRDGIHLGLSRTVRPTSAK
jgi:hypothetical protein